MFNLIDLVGSISDWMWGPPMLMFIVGGGIFLTVRLGFFQIIYYPYILKQTFGTIFKKSKGEGTVSPFQAATTALASTIGASNIVGVPIAIAFGGPGAVFWMWVISLIGCATKFSEIVLGVKYRVRNEDGQYVGGPMYYLSAGFPDKTIGETLGVVYAFFTMLILAASVAAQSVSATQTVGVMGVSSLTTGILLTILVSIIAYGGITRIASVTSKLVPLMAGVYIAGSLIVILCNITAIPEVFILIFQSAFSPSATAGGLTGFGAASAMRWGIARGTYSCEAGMGTAPVAHSAAATDHPVRQGFWGIFEITVSSLIICTMSALVVLTTGIWNQVDAASAASMPTLAFQSVLGHTFGGLLVSFSMLMFVISTIIVQVFYGEKQCEFFFGTKIAKILKVFYILAILAGALGGLQAVFGFLDVVMGITIIPNMLGLIFMSGQVAALKKEFFSGSKYYLKDKRRSRSSL